MNTSLYYCMSNTQLRRILYACGKSLKAKNKAAAILRIRKTNKQQQQVSIGGFSIKYGMIKHQILPDTILPSFTKKNKGNLKQGKSTVKRTLNFSNLEVVEAGSLCLQGRAPYNQYRVINFRKNRNNEYRHGARRITGPRRRIEVSEDVPSTVTDVQPAVVKEKINLQIIDTEQQQIEKENQQQQVEEKPQHKVCEGAQSCGLNQERAADPKPVGATFRKIIARSFLGVTGLICLLFVIRCLPNQYKLKMARILATLVAVSPFLLLIILIKSCCRCCCESKVKESEYQKQLRLLAERNIYRNPNVRSEPQQTDFWQRDQ